MPNTASNRVNLYNRGSSGKGVELVEYRSELLQPDRRGRLFGRVWLSRASATEARQRARPRCGLSIPAGIRAV